VIGADVPKQESTLILSATSRNSTFAPPLALLAVPKSKQISSLADLLASHPPDASSSPITANSTNTASSIATSTPETGSGSLRARSTLSTLRIAQSRASYWRRRHRRKTWTRRRMSGSMGWRVSGLVCVGGSSSMRVDGASSRWTMVFAGHQLMKELRTLISPDH